MKKLLVLLIIILIVLFNVNLVLSGDSTEARKAEVSICPVSKISDNNKCFSCHVLNSRGEFAVKETDPKEDFIFPNAMTSIKVENGNKIGYYLLQGNISNTDANLIQDAFTYFSWHSEIKKVVIEVHSFGGEMLASWKIVGLINYWKKNYIIETRMHGFGASAAFMIFCAGTKGERVINSRALIMWHELWSFEMFKISTPTTKEKEAEVFRFLQDNCNEWIASVSNLSKEEIDKKVRDKEFWMNGIMAHEYGFADKIY